MSRKATSRVRDEAKDFLRDDLLGAPEYRASKLGYFTGLSSFVRSGAASLRSGNQGRVFIVSLAKKVFWPEPVEKLDAQTDDPAERFKIAQEKYGTSQEDLETMTRRTARQTWILLALVIGLLGYGFSLLPSSEAEVRNFFISYIFPFFPLTIAVPLLVRTAFWNWQMRTRRLAGVKEFLRNPENWLPSGRGAAGMLVLTALLGTMLMAPGYALADQHNLSSNATGLEFLDSATGGSDLFYQLLQVLAPVGPVDIGVIPSPWAGPLSVAFGTFNATLLAVAGAMLGWHTLAGMIATAHEGKMLGQRWHQIWAPVRVTAGIGTLVPAAGGFSAIQLIVLQLALWGSGLANTVWSSYIETYKKPEYLAAFSSSAFGERKDYSQAIAALTEDENAQALIFGMLEKHMCVAGVREAVHLSVASQMPNGAGSGDYSFSGVTEGDWPRYMAGLSNHAPLLAPHVGPRGTAPLDFDALAAGRVAGKNGMSQGNAVIIKEVGSIRQEEIIQGMAVGEIATVTVGANPVAVWDYGVCGRMQVNFLDIDPLVDRLEHGIGDLTTYTEGRWEKKFGFIPVKGDNTVQVDEQKKEQLLADHKKFYDAVEASTNRLRRRVDSYVTPLIADAADLILEAYNPAIGGSEANDAARELTFDPKGEVAQLLGEAYQTWVDIAQKERSGVESSVYNILNENEAIDDFIDLSMDMGWSSAGSFYMMLAHVQKLNFLVGPPQPEFSGGMRDSSFDLKNSREDILSLFSDPETGVISAYEKFSEYAKENISPNVSQLARNWQNLNIDSDTSIIDDFIDPLEGGINDWQDGETYTIYPGGQKGWISSTIDGFQKTSSAYASTLLNIMVGTFSPDPYGALVDLVAFGHAIIQVAMVILFTAMAISLFTGKFSLVVDLVTNNAGGGIIQGLMGVLKIAATVIIIVGLVHAFILPMIPYIMFTFFVVGMLILIAEALVAAPLWAFFHVRMDGQEFVDQVQRPGYMIAFNLFLRPTLAIFGLILSYSLFSASIWFLNATFEIAVYTAMSEGTSFIGVVVALMIMTYMHWQMAIRSFALINQVPDRVTRWFGQGGEQLGEADEANRTTALFIGKSEDKFREMGAMAGTRSKGDTPGSDKDDTKGSDPAANNTAPSQKSKPSKS